MSSVELMHRVDALISHVWMVRTFLKHSEEAAEDEELSEVHRELYDYMLALGPAWQAGDADEYLKLREKSFEVAEYHRAIPGHTARDFDAHEFSNGRPVAQRCRA